MAPVLGEANHMLDNETQILDVLLKDDESGVCPESPTMIRKASNIESSSPVTVSSSTVVSTASTTNDENQEVQQKDLVTPRQKNPSTRDVNLAINNLLTHDELSPSALSASSLRSTRKMPDSVAFTKNFLESTSEELSSSPPKKNKRRPRKSKSDRGTSVSPMLSTASGETSSSSGFNTDATAENITDDIRDLFLDHHPETKGGTSKNVDSSTVELLDRARDRIEHQKLQEQLEELRRRVQEKDARIAQLTAQLRRATAAKCDLVLACTEIEGQLENVEREGELSVQRIKMENLRLLENQNAMEVGYINEMGKLTEKIRELTRTHQNEILEKEFHLAKSQETIRRLKCSINTKAANQSVAQNSSSSMRSTRPRPPSSVWKKDGNKHSSKIPEHIML